MTTLKPRTQMDLIGKFAFLLGFLGSVARDVLPPSCQVCSLGARLYLGSRV